MRFFDLHVHPSLKGGLSRDVNRYNAWEKVELFQVPAFVLKKFLQILNSQSTLTQLQSAGTVAVVSLTAMERAFAWNLIIYVFLADPSVSPLSRPKLRALRKDKITYYKFYERDLQQMIDAKQLNGGYNLVRKYSDIQPGQLNILFSIEGVHSLQNVKDKESDSAKAASIIFNFTQLKNNAVYRILFLTLAHLTRQPASVHCHGVRMRKLFELFPEIDFLPDPEKIGISRLGEEIIRIAYKGRESPVILIDVKHMSLVSRKQFYELRRQNGWAHLPIIASHMGVTGVSYTRLRIKEIVPGRNRKACDEIFWWSKKGLGGTKFNPWTINLYDEEIQLILESKGLIGISLDQRIIGEGKIYGEYMSKLEVQDLGLGGLTTKDSNDDFTDPVSVEEDRALYTDFFKDPGIRDFLEKRGIVFNDDGTPDLENQKGLRSLRPEILFDIDRWGYYGVSHFDYLANNILHVIKVGLQAGYDGTNRKADVRKSICIGSDLDGLIDAMNFPDWANQEPVEEDNWVEMDEYPDFETELIESIDKLKQEEATVNGGITDPADLVRNIMSNNGMEFIRNNFT